MSKLEELKQEAKDLGVEFSPNIGEKKLQEKIDAYYESQETSTIVVDEEPEEVVEEATEAKGNDKGGLPKDPKRRMAMIAKELEAKARVTHIVTITDNDQRENNLTTTVSVNCGNGHFELGTKRIPLNVPVELEQGFIDVLKEIKIPMHVTDQRTGLGKTVLRNRYSLNYEDELKKD